MASVGTPVFSRVPASRKPCARFQRGFVLLHGLTHRHAQPPAGLDQGRLGLLGSRFRLQYKHGRLNVFLCESNP